jgi:hypothetical protein
MILAGNRPTGQKIRSPIGSPQVTTRGLAFLMLTSPMRDVVAKVDDTRLFGWADGRRDNQVPNA